MLAGVYFSSPAPTQGPFSLLAREALQSARMEHSQGSPLVLQQSDLSQRTDLATVNAAGVGGFPYGTRKGRVGRHELW